MNEKKIRFNRMDLIFYFLIILFCMNFFSKGSLICFVFCIYGLIRYNVKIKFDFFTIIAFLLTIVACSTSLIYYGILEFIKCTVYFFIYLIGYNSFINSKEKDAFIKKSIFSVFLGYSLFIIMTFFYNFNNEILKGDRTIINIWTGESIAVTLIGLVSSVVIGYSFYAIFIQKKLFIKIYSVLALILACVININTATRTPFILMFINFIIIGLIYLFNTKKIINFKFIILIVTVLSFFLIAFSNDLFGLKTYIMESSLFKRLSDEGLSTSRIEIFKIHLKEFKLSIYGGNYISNTTGFLAHNFIQQGHDLYGLMATIVLIMMLICFFINIMKILKNKEKEKIDYLIISMYISMIIQMFLEPVLTGYPCYFFCMLFIHGMTNAYLIWRKTNENSGNKCGI